MNRYVLGCLGLVLAGGASSAWADAPCGDLGECRVFIEINATDGDIGFHVLFDSDGWKEARILDPGRKLIFKSQANAGLQAQNLTENFFESAEPVCEAALAEDPDEVVVTLPEFLARFPAGTYGFRIKLAQDKAISGSTALTHQIPAAPADVDFDGSEISWSYGDDLGECTTLPAGFAVATEANIIGYEVVMDPVDPALTTFKFTTQIPNGASSVTVPVEYPRLVAREHAAEDRGWGDRTPTERIVRQPDVY